jgi:hypothetical protein
MKNYEDCTWIEKGALIAFKEKFFNKKIARPLRFAAFVIVVISLIIVNRFWTRHLWSGYILTVAMEYLMASYFIHFLYLSYTDRVIKSQIWKYKWAMDKITEYFEFILKYEVQRAKLDILVKKDPTYQKNIERLESIRKIYIKRYDAAIRFLACAEVPSRK